MKLRNHEWLRFGRLAGLLRIVVCLMGMVRGVAAPAQAISTTTVQGTVYLANGEPGAGTLVVSWPSFTTASGQVVVAGQTAVTIAPDGFLSVNLTPNLGATPAGLYYTAVYYLSDGTTTTQYWVVPAAAQATLAQIQSQLMPPAQAVQAVSKAYVDQAIQSLASGVLSVSSATMTGALTLCCDPTQPLQAADKHYVDENIALAVPISGGTMTGPLTSTKIGGLYQVDQFTGSGSASFNGPTVTVGVSGSQTGTVKLSSNTSGGSVAITPASASSAYTATLPAANDTLVELAQTQTLTNKSIALSEVNSGYNAGGIVGATSTTAACSSTYTANAVVKMASSSSTCPGASSLIDTGTNVYTTEPSYYANGNQLLGTAATSITSTALASASIAFPATSGQFAAQYTGFCHIVWQQSTAAATVQFGINASSAPTHMSLSSISYPGTTAVPYGTGVTDITTASAVAATGSITPGAAGTNYITEITVNLSAPATANTLTLYALTSNASDALLIEPGTVCRWY